MSDEIMSDEFYKELSRKAPTIKKFLERMEPPLHQSDVYATAGIQIEIRQDGETVWINVDGVCALRIFNPDEKFIEIKDNRPKSNVR